MHVDSSTKMARASSRGPAHSETGRPSNCEPPTKALRAHRNVGEGCVRGVEEHGERLGRRARDVGVRDSLQLSESLLHVVRAGVRVHSKQLEEVAGRGVEETLVAIFLASNFAIVLIRVRGEHEREGTLSVRGRERHTAVSLASTSLRRGTRLGSTPPSGRTRAPTRHMGEH